MTVYSYAQLMSLWINAGGPKALAPLAAAIAEAESGGNSDAYNGHDSNGRGGTQVSAGLWQISNGTMTPVPGWSNPAVNAKDAVGKWKGAGGFSPWGTYTSGAYKAYMNGSTTPDPNVPGSPTQLTAAAAAASQADCLLGSGGIPGTAFIGDLFGGGGNVGSFCLFTKSEARAVLAVANLAAGMIILGVGFGFVMAFSRPGRMILHIVAPQTGALGRAVTGRAAPEASRPKPKLAAVPEQRDDSDAA